jgi:7,8-dihydroneopterin aldolase/epimerase/oxygenase
MDAAQVPPISAELRTDGIATDVHEHSSVVLSQSEMIAATSRSRFFIRRLYLDAKLGLCEWERVGLQPVVIDMEFQLPTGISCLTDRLEHTIDHRTVVERIRAFVHGRHYDLVEALAEGIARLMQSQFGVTWLALSVTKHRPFPSTEVGISIERGARNC